MRLLWLNNKPIWSTCFEARPNVYRGNFSCYTRIILTYTHAHTYYPLYRIAKVTDVESVYLQIATVSGTIRTVLIDFTS